MVLEVCVKNKRDGRKRIQQLDNLIDDGSYEELKTREDGV